jgi:tetrahydromethanopterin S-methyltransferase subunit B
MIGEQEDVRCGCELAPPLSEVEECGCTPNVALTCQEEAILAKMREVKDQVRSLTARMKELRESFDPNGAPGSGEGESEWAQLTGQLEELRNQWKAWETKLDEAIERKLIILGHREMRA